MFNRLIIAAVFLCAGIVSAQEADSDATTKTTVTMHTSRGAITLELFPEQAPATVENFLQYARDGFYEGTIFHRVISHFMIQGGGFTTEMIKKETREAIENEATNGLNNNRGTIAMARTSDPHSATAQFFINVQDNSPLDHTGTGSSREWGYVVFGEVTAGMDVVDDIRFVETTVVNGMRDVPVETIVIERVEIPE
jgi:cyclophilin family peptidyl-prolyl cis-trans isomerase